MKRTTYISTGILASVLAILIVGVVYIPFRKSDRDPYILTLSDELPQTEFPDARAVKVYASDTRHAWLEQARANVMPSTDGKTRLFSPKSKYLKISQDTDTLVICLDLTNYDLPEQKKKHLIPGLWVKGLQFTIEADANLAFLTNTIHGLRTNMNEIKTDPLAMYIQSGEVRLDSREIRALYVDGDGVTFNAHQSIIPYLCLDLDGVRNWGVHECTIGTKHLTGSGTYHRNEPQKGERKKMVRIPKKKGVVPHVTMKEKGCLVLQDE